MKSVKQDGNEECSTCEKIDPFIQMSFFVSLPDIHSVSLSGASTFRVWQSANPGTNDTPLFVSGQTVTTGINGISWGTNDTAHYDGRRQYLNDRAVSVYPVASSLLRWFLARTDLPSPFDSITSQAINCFSLGSLTHNAGASFQSDGSGSVVKSFWTIDSTASHRIAGSEELEVVVNSMVSNHLPEITSHFTAFPSTNQFEAAWTTNSVFVDFSETDYVFSPIEFDLHSAFGRTVLPNVSISIVVKKNLLGNLYIDMLTLSGSLDELYDFDFEAGGPATSAAAVQIGREFMRPGRDAGRIFFDHTDFYKEFDNWDFDFP